MLAAAGANVFAVVASGDGVVRIVMCGIAEVLWLVTMVVVVG